MKQKMNVSLFFMFLIFSNPLFAIETLSSKLTLKSGFEQLANQGTTGGTAAGGAGFELGYYTFLTPRLTVGVGYTASFDLKEKSMPVNGYFLSGRFYFLKSGTKVTNTETWGSSVEHSQWSPYVGMAYHQMKYYLGLDKEGAEPTDTLTGEYANGTVSLGVDYRIDKRFEWNFEGRYAPFVFSASDPRVRIQHAGVLIGLTLVF